LAAAELMADEGLLLYIALLGGKKMPKVPVMKQDDMIYTRL